MSESREIRTLRAMEWERAKGSLRAILASVWDWDKDYADDPDIKTFRELKDMVEGFIEEFGDEALLT